MMEYIALIVILGIWLNIAIRLIGFQILTREWKRGFRYVDHDTCMCGSTGGSCVSEMSHGFMSTYDYWLEQKPEYE